MSTNQPAGIAGAPLSGNFLAAFDAVHEHWSPQVIGQVNDQYLKVAKLLGEFTWHQHDAEDELFYIVRGNLVIHYPEQQVHLGIGDFHIVPRGVQHKPVAEEECWVVLIETVTTQHTGGEETPLTRSIEEQLNH